MASGFVRRVRRTRSSKTVDTFSEFDDDEPLPDWDEKEDCAAGKRAITDTSNDISKMAVAISQRWYPDDGSLTWPDDYSSKAKAMKNDAREAFRIEWALNKALTTALAGSLGELELKVMLFILNRTWAWKKPRDGIPFSHFSKGVFMNGKMVQAPILKSPDHFHDKCKRLEEKRLIRITDAHCQYGRVKVYEIDVERVINMARQKLRSARKR